MTSYISLLNKIEAFCNAHLQIKKYKGEFREQMPNFSTMDEKYPIVFVVPTSDTETLELNQFTLEIYCVDIIQKDRANLNTIVSDCHLILKDLYLYFKDGSDLSVDVIADPTMTPLNNFDLDYVAGWVMTITFEVEGYSVCAIPMNPIPPFTPSCEDATYEITDTAGNVLYSGSVVSGGELNQAIQDSTITNSDGSYTGSVLAEGLSTLPDITVTDSDGSTYTLPSVTDVFCTPCEGVDVFVGEANVGSFPSGSDVFVKVIQDGLEVIPEDVTVVDDEVNIILADTPPCHDTNIEVNGVSEGSVVAGSTVDVQLSDSNGTVTPDSVTLVGNDLQIVLPDAPPSTPQYIVEGYFPNASYSLRKVSSNATNSIRVRRSSDNAEQDIGFVGDDLDTSTLLSFVGAGDGFVVRIYNQGGIGSPFNSVPYLDAVMSSSSIQPKIVSSGSLVTLNGSPSMLFDGVDDRINFGVYEGTANTIWDLYSTFRVNTNEQFVLYVNSNNNAPQGGFYIVGENGSASAISNPFSSLYKNGASWSPTTRNQVHDELATNQMVLLSSLMASNIGWGFNGYEIPTWNFVGYWCETIIFERDTSAIRVDLETNINNYYNVYP